MASKTLPPADELRDLFRYDPTTGKLFWRERKPEQFVEMKPGRGYRTREETARSWNSNNAGREIATRLPTGHIYMSINRVKALAHRIIWKMVHGVDPDCIDHISGDPSDNRLENLRSVAQAINARNTRLGKNNTSGFNGVRMDPRTGRWLVRVSYDYRSIHIGVFDRFDEACKARKNAEAQYGFHKNHGRVAA